MNQTFKMSLLVGVISGVGSQLPWLLVLIP